jgi:hypothetical protein
MGRPRKSEAPRIDYQQVDRLLVFGEVVPADDGKGTAVYFPSYRELGERYGVAHSLIAQYSKRHDCMGRREVAQARITAQSDHKLVELRANAIAYTREEEMRLVDTYLAGFERALSEGRIRFDSPSDFNTILRLKMVLRGDVDSRQEVHTWLSLEDLQARHVRMLRRVDTSGAAPRQVPGGGHPVLPASASEVPGGIDPGIDPPIARAEPAPAEVAGQFSATPVTLVSGQFPGHFDPDRAQGTSADDEGDE